MARSLTTQILSASNSLSRSLEMAECIKMENKQITCVTIISITEIARMGMPPRTYIGAHFIGWIQWYFMDLIEKLPRKIWKMVLQYKNGTWHKAWEKSDPTNIKFNRLVPDTFTPTPDTVQRPRRNVRELLPQGRRRCRCGEPIPNIF